MINEDINYMNRYETRDEMRNLWREREITSENEKLMIRPIYMNK